MRGLGASTSACSSGSARGSASARARARLPALQATKKGKGGAGPVPPPPDAAAAPTPAKKAAAKKPPAGSRGVPTTAKDTAWGGSEVDALGRDRLAALGRNQDYNINVTHGQNLAHLDSLFVGKTLG